MYEKGLVSIGLPAYKANYLKDAINSILKQTYTQFELIIVNDKSPENLDKIVKEYNDERIHYYVNEKNLGGHNLVDNWNRCFSYAKGEFFVLASDDDIYSDVFLETLIKLSEKYPQTNVFRARGQIINNRNEILDYYPSSPEYEDCIDYVWHRISGFRHQTMPEFMFRTELLKKINGFVSFPKAWYSDDATVFLMSQEGGIASSTQCLFNFRQSGENISSDSSNIDDKIEANMIFTQWLNSFLDNFQNPFKKNLIMSKRNKKSILIYAHLLSYCSLKKIFSFFKRRKNLGITNRSFIYLFFYKIKRAYV